MTMSALRCQDIGVLTWLCACACLSRRYYRKTLGMFGVEAEGADAAVPTVWHCLGVR